MMVFRCGSHAKSGIALVDSGADGTLLPKSMAPDLGLDPKKDLKRVKGGSGGAGGTSFPTWTASHAITGRIVALPSTGPKLWGPSIKLQPVFAEGEQILLGRCDFFAYFNIAFGNHSTRGPYFRLRY
jgi:hypothetical protein